MSEPLRLSKRMSELGLCSRREADEWISRGWVRVDGVIVSPHVSGVLPSYDDRCSELFADNVRRFLGGEPLVNLVDRAKGY